MATASSIKASEKQALCKKLTTTLKKRYGGSLPKIDLPVLETLIYAACLEDETYERAQEYYDRLFEVFHDLNEIRVSSIWELEEVFEGISDPDWRALKVRSALQYVFEKNYVFEFEGIRKKTQDLAARQLGKIPSQTPFIVNFVMQQALDSHVIPLDETMRNAAVFLGLLERSEKAADGAESLKAAIRKADVPLFVFLLKSLAVEPLPRELIAEELEFTEEEFDPTTGPKRLAELLEVADNPRKRSRKKKPAAKKATTKKATAKKSSKTGATAKKSTSKAKKKPAATSKTPARKK